MNYSSAKFATWFSQFFFPKDPFVHARWPYANTKIYKSNIRRLYTHIMNIKFKSTIYGNIQIWIFLITLSNTIIIHIKKPFAKTMTNNNKYLSFYKRRYIIWKSYFCFWKLFLTAIHGRPFFRPHMSDHYRWFFSTTRTRFPWFISARVSNIYYLCSKAYICTSLL